MPFLEIQCVISKWGVHFLWKRVTTHPFPIQGPPSKGDVQRRVVLEGEPQRTPPSPPLCGQQDIAGRGALPIVSELKR